MNCYKLETSSFEKVRIPVKQYLCNTIFAHIQITRKHIPIPINDYEITVNYKTLDNEFLFSIMFVPVSFVLSYVVCFP